MVLVCTGSFANAVLILNSAAKRHVAIDGGDSSENPLVEDKFGNVVIDAFMQQYELGLGEFENYVGAFENSSQSSMLWIYFCMATFLTQIIFINTLIAILGDTYNRIMD